MSDDDLETAAKRLAELVGRDDLDGDHDASLVRLIRVRRRVGEGSIDDPNRVVTTLHTLDGQLVHTEDPAADEDPRISLLREALEEVMGQAVDLTEGHTSDDRVAYYAERRKKLEKLTDPEWRP